MKKIILLYLIISSPLLTAQETIYFLDSNQDLERQAVIRYLMDAFELENPNISIKLELYKDDDSLENILSPDDGASPHLIMADSKLLYRLSYINDLDLSLTAELIEEVSNDMYAGALKAFQKKEIFLGIPYSAWLQVLWYREDWFQRNNLNPPDDPNSILKAAETFYNKEASQYGIILGEREDSYLEQCFLHLAGAEGALLLSKDNKTCAVDNEVFRKTLRLYSRLCQLSVPGKDYWRARDYFFQNRASMLFYSTFLMDDLALEKVMEDSLGSRNFTDLNGCDYDPDFFNNVGMITTISEQNPSVFGSISGIGILGGATETEKESIKSLIRFLFRQDVYISWLHMCPGGMLPVKRDILESDAYYQDSGEVFKRFGRKQIIELVQGLEYLRVTNPEELLECSESGYKDKDFLRLLFECLEAPLFQGQLISQEKWIK